MAELRNYNPTILDWVQQNLNGRSVRNALAQQFTAENALNIPRNAGAIVNNALVDVSRTGQDLVANALKDPSLSTGQPLSPQRAFDAVGNTALAAMPAAAMMRGGGAALGSLGASTKPAAGIKAYHGSPHDFDRFSMDKIGTGEGAQAYGHGLYFAESPGVANFYKNELAPNNVSFRGKNFNDDYVAKVEIPQTLQDEISARFGRDLTSDEKAAIRLAVTDYVDDVPKPTNVKNDFPHGVYADARKMLDDGGFSSTKAEGRLYEVNIKADKEDFLDWDKPLSEQGANVKGLLEDYQGGGHVTKFEDMWIAKDPTHGWSHHKTYDEAVASLNSRLKGEDLYRSLSDADRKTVLDEFTNRGIPGIKYLDQGSRQLKVQVNLPDGVPANVRNILERVVEREHIASQPGRGGRPNIKGLGDTALQRVRNDLRQAAEIEEIPEAVEALRLLDDGKVSFSQGGTYNYVVFDEKLIDITKKMGIGVPMGGGVSLSEEQMKEVQSAADFEGKMSELESDTWDIY